MLKIGEFAKICGASVQTLRYYDKIGVLCADRVDAETGYRYYNPEKIKTFRLIEQLKQLDFSLDEIKQFLACSPTEQCRIYRDKKQSILEGIHQKHHQIGQIDEFCGNTQPGALPLTQQILQMPFEDDPRVIGKWVYCGELDISQPFTQEEHLTKSDVLQKHLYFLPSGGHVWMYYWSTDFLYYMMPSFNVIVPNAYRIFHVGDATYMEIDWMVDIFIGETHDRTIRIYRQEDNREYTERETFAVRDNIDVPYVADERVMGEWETVDCVRDPRDFDSKHRYWQDEFWIVDMKFHNRVCAQTRKHNGVLYPKGLKYSAGVVLDDEMGYAQHYTIHTEQGVDYLIMEHKSGDYSHTGKVLCYYVFKRKPS